ncbi:MAG: putative outer membrane protein, partial [Deltaproteobacteria bacterium]|nr:putative outer membrane protein [Deltaproteobacteria bacterium]
ASATVRVITPTYRLVRMVALATVATRWNDTVSSALGFFSLGSANGLRGFQINEFRGQRLVSGQFELRTVSRSLWMLRAGSVLFYDVGGATQTFETMQLHHDVGAGVRVLIPQNGRDVFRFDFAIPLDGQAAGKLRLIAAFESAF